MKSKISIQLGARIKELREARGISQAALAKKILKSIETISNFERGKTTPSIASLEVLAKALGVEIKNFFETAKQTEKLSKNISSIENNLQLLSSNDQETVALFVESLCKKQSKK